MVCDRCISTVRRLLNDLGYEVNSVRLGEAVISETPAEDELHDNADKLRQDGFELIHKNQSALTEDVKSNLIGYLKRIENEVDPPKLSAFLSDKLHRNYSYLSNRFSKLEGTTIEQYMIRLKIERVKELLTYQEMTLSEIAWKLNYSSVQYLSNQFKKVTGQTVSDFRSELDELDRKSLDAIR
ncbi:AraC family transcriptional regulator [Aliifodinibius salicampi]|uniref:AraC family transcriptional regulator n=2 Tax=Fodinibius salicampi TaxID=1920655 RepID=A0ABT3PZC8_9BACT|nr:AraC family transcriptional regulator [Fodinibius salicampi]MCW9713220.1 AraC family transcriptional regulator [Fodinibius salicampi]